MAVKTRKKQEGKKEERRQERRKKTRKKREGIIEYIRNAESYLCCISVKLFNHYVFDKFLFACIWKQFKINIVFSE